MRLAVRTALLLAALVALVLAGVYAATAELLLRQVDVRLQESAQGSAPSQAPRWSEAFEGGSHEHGPEPEGELEREHEPRPEHEELWSFTIRRGGPEGEERWALAWLWPLPGDVRVARDLQAPDRPLASEALDDVAQVLAGLRWYLAGIGAMATVLVSTVAFVSARRAFQPVEAITRAASRILEAPRVGADTLSLRLPRTGWSDASLERLSLVLDTMLARVRQAFLAQARFVDDASHELRTPIGALRANLEVALKEVGSSSPCAQALSRSLAQVDRLARLADDLLALARYERGGLIRVQADVDLVRCASEAMSDVRHLAERAGVVLVMDAPSELRAHADPGAVARLVTNLLQNAIGATPAGGEVALRLSAQPGGALIEVADSGRGMTPEQAARAFEPFFQAPGAEARPEDPGTGLGLAISKAIVEAHGGRLQLDTAPGRGTRVRVELPGAPPPSGPRGQL